MKKKITILLVALFSIILIGFNYDDIPKKYLEYENKVVVTIYKPHGKHNVTASGAKFGQDISDTTKWIAVSRDMLKFYSLGSKVLLTGAGDLNGIYYVMDIMPPQWHKKIDVLVPKTHKNVKYTNATLNRIKENYL